MNHSTDSTTIPVNLGTYSFQFPPVNNSLHSTHKIMQFCSRSISKLQPPPPTFTTMNKVSALLYCLLLLTVYFSNKLVLTVLGFTYPMVFQGWQTLVGFVVFKALQVGKVIPVASIPLDRAGCISLLPNFLFFTAGIIAGSKALAYIPLYIFLAVSNILPAGVFFFDNVLFPKKTSEATTAGDSSKLQICAASIVIVTGTLL